MTDCERCAHPVPGMPPHDPSPLCERAIKTPHCVCARCFG